MPKVTGLKHFSAIDLKLGIKSSMPKVKPTVALLLLLNTVFDDTDSITYSKVNEQGELCLSEDIFDKLVSKHEQILTEVNLDSDSFKDILNKNNLFTSQIEALIVTFELCYELARFSFENSSLSYASERTGGKRFPKNISFTSQIDYLSLIFSEEEIHYHRLLLNWVGLDNIPINKSTESKLIKFLTLNSENSIYKLIHNEQDIVFNNHSIYTDLLNGHSPVDIKSDKEAKGSLRILPNILKENLNYYLKIDNSEVVPNVSINELKSYKNRLEKYFELENKRVALSQLDSKLTPESEEIDNNVDEELTDYEQMECKKRPDLVQEIHFGAPGTGKSYSLAQIIGESYENYKETDDNPFVFRTTVHNEYSYFDFVGNVMPETDEDGKIKYDFKAGIFTQSLATALKNEDKDIYLIIEEMSRGNIASIFGDIFQLLDRKDNGESEYHINNELIYNELVKQGVTGLAKDKIYLPSNFHILGTANTSDQNVNVIDTAFKRRFGFVYQQVSPKYKYKLDENGDFILDEKGEKIKDGYLNTCTFKLGSQEFEWNDFYQKVNDYIVDEDRGLGLTEDKQLGQFFVKFKENDDETNSNFDSIRNKVIHYLWEDVQSVSMTGRKIFVPKSFSKLYELFDPETKVFQIFDSQFMKFYSGES